MPLEPRTPPKPGTLSRPMRWRLMMRNMSVSAPRVTVRSELPWTVKMLIAFVMAMFAAAAGVAVYEYGRNFSGPDRKELLAEVEKLGGQVRELTADRDRLQAVATSWESQIKVERAAQEQLVQQVRALEIESNKLKEDLSFFESLLPAGTGSHGIVIRSFRVQPEGEPNVLRYRLLVQQSKAERDFAGAVQMVVTYVLGNRPATLQVPEPEADADRVRSLTLSFRYYQRVEGTFVLPPGAVARSVQVRVVKGNDTQTQQTFTL